MEHERDSYTTDNFNKYTKHIFQIRYDVDSRGRTLRNSLNILLINLFLFINAQSTRSHIDQQQQSANNRESLEEVVSNVRHILNKAHT